MAGMLFWCLNECSLPRKILPLFKSDLVFISEKLLTCSIVCLALLDGTGSFLAVADFYRPTMWWYKYKHVCSLSGEVIVLKKNILSLPIS